MWKYEVEDFTSSVIKTDCIPENKQENWAEHAYMKVVIPSMLQIIEVGIARCICNNVHMGRNMLEEDTYLKKRDKEIKVLIGTGKCLGGGNRMIKKKEGKDGR